MTTPGAIGYIEYGYAKSQNLPMAILENKSGSFVAPIDGVRAGGPGDGAIPRQPDCLGS